jgi:hypothetical protein
MEVEPNGREVELSAIELGTKCFGGDARRYRLGVKG